MSDCGEFPGEVFVGRDGTYLGAFDGPVDTFGDPLGWVHCMADCEDSGSAFRDFYVTPCACGTGDPNPPRATVPFEFSEQRLTVISDTSGPTGLEDELALQIDGSGVTNAAIAWVGSQHYDYDTSAWRLGALPNHPDDGWYPKADESWTFQCWAKVVPDYESFTPDDTQLGFTAAMSGSGTGVVDERETISTSDWTFMEKVFDWVGPDTGPGESVPFVFPVLEIHGTEWTRREIRTIDVLGTPTDVEFYIERGRLLIKCAHLYPTVPPTPTVTGGVYLEPRTEARNAT